MSRRRFEDKDRLHAQSDYRVNLKAELEIRHLHDKLDHLISKQWQRLSKIQQLHLASMQMNNVNRTAPIVSKAPSYGHRREGRARQ